MNGAFSFVSGIDWFAIKVGAGVFVSIWAIALLTMAWSHRR
jgi:hypothetical protein